MRATRITRRIDAPRHDVFRALVEPESVARWLFPAGMTGRLHTYEPREGGRIHVSLTYDAPTGEGKTTPQTDTYHGRFVEIVPDLRVVEVVEFDTPHPSLRGEMTITVELFDAADGGTEIHARHDHLPPGLASDANELGWRHALDQLAALLGSD